MDEISISDIQITRIKKKIKDFFDIIKRYFPQIRGYAFGGSFDRYTAIPDFYDIDLYFIFANATFEPLSGEVMLNTLINILAELETDDEEDDLTPYYISVKRARNYYHSIPMSLDDIKIDCLAAVEIPEHPHTYYIPNSKQIEVSKPVEIEDRIQFLNKQSNGMGTKLIRLLKLWNYTHGKNLKSYQLELLCCYIFREKSFDSLQSGIVKFMRKGLEIIQVHETSFIKWMLDHKIDYKAINQFRDGLSLINNNKWEEIF